MTTKTTLAQRELELGRMQTQGPHSLLEYKCMITIGQIFRHS